MRDMLGGGCTEFDSSDDAISTAFEVVLMECDVLRYADTPFGTNTVRASIMIYARGEL